MSARVVNAERNTAGAPIDGADDRAHGSLDDLRLRLDSPLFAREPGLASAAPMPGLRELTWEHVINPTSSHPVVTDGPPPDEGPARPTPIRIEDLLARPEPALAPLPERADAPASPSSLNRRADERVDERDEERVERTPSEPMPSAVPAAGLPSFAAMLSGEVATSGSWNDGQFADDSLVKPIEEPPPVARDTDPAVNGLAELIMKSTPDVGMPLVDGLRDPMRPPTGTVPVIPPAPLDPPVLDAAVEFAQAQSSVAPNLAPVPSTMPPSTMSPPLVRDTGVHSVLPKSAVEAELNRLAYVPDLADDTVGPVEVPQIAYSDVRRAEPVVAAASLSAPSLSQHEMFMPRQPAAVSRHAYADLVAQPAPVVRRRKRHIVRKILTTVILLGMVAGGLFAVKYFVLDRVKWAGDVAPLAAAVETERGLHFDHDIPVVPLSVADYATKIEETIGGLTPDSATVTESTWRALGVVSGTLDKNAIGLAAMVDSPAFYDPASPTIYVVAGLDPTVRTFAMHRALTMALLDQQFKWGKGTQTSAPAVKIGTRALMDGDALAVAMSLLNAADRAALPAKLAELATANNVAASPSPFASVSVSRLGVGLWPYFQYLRNDQRNAMEKDPVMTDDHALDLRRLTAGATDAVDASAQGMLFWYHVLAGRLDDDLAWNAALGWRGDDLSVDTSNTPACVTAHVTIDAPLAQTALLAFTAWASGGPPEAGTTVAMAPGANGAGTLTIHACDPGATAASNDGTPQLTLGAAPLRAAQLNQMLTSSQQLTIAQATCALYSGTDHVTIADERPVMDPAGYGALNKHVLPDANAVGCMRPAPSSGTAAP